MLIDKNNSIWIIDWEVAGMGRLIGDCARIFYIQDLFIKPEYQRKGIGKLIVEKLLEYIKPYIYCKILSCCK